MRARDELEAWSQVHTARYISARDAAGTPQRIEFANRLSAMLPHKAAAEIAEMFCLVADEDLPYEIAQDLELCWDAAERIGLEIVRKRWGLPVEGRSTSSGSSTLGCGGRDQHVVRNHPL